MTNTKKEINQTSCARKADFLISRLWKPSPIWIRFQSLTKSNGSPICVCPAVTGRVTATSSHMHFCQEEKTIWHGAPWRWLHRGISPVYCHSLSLIEQTMSIEVVWRQLRMIREEGKQVFFRATAVIIVEFFTIRRKPKTLSIHSSYIGRKNPWWKQSFWKSHYMTKYGVLQ